MSPGGNIAWRLALVAFVAAGTVALAGGEPLAQQAEQQPFRLSPDSSLPALGPERLRVVPPPARVRITDEARDGDRGRDGDDERALQLRNRAVDTRAVPESTRRSNEAAQSDSDDVDAPPARDRANARTRARAQSDRDSDRDDDSRRRGRSRRQATAADTHPPLEDAVPVGYGRLIVITGFDNIQVTIDGQPYPYGSMEGVLLWANELYEVVLEEVDDSSDSRSSSSGGASRVIDIRVEAGETRVLMANLGGEQSGRVSSRPSRESSRRSSRSDNDDDEEEIGYLGVSSSPRGIVYVDGENTGQMTPARRIELEPGRHEVRIFYESEDEFSETKNVLIREGVNTNVFFRMRRDELEDDEED